MVWMYAINADGSYDLSKGDSGSMSIAERLNCDNKLESHHNSKPLLGYSMIVGSVTGRSYSNQDFWITTPVKKIVDEWLDEQNILNVIFETNNSTYHWRQ